MSTPTRKRVGGFQWQIRSHVISMHEPAKFPPSPSAAARPGDLSYPDARARASPFARVKGQLQTTEGTEAQRFTEGSLTASRRVGAFGNEPGFLGPGRSGCSLWRHWLPIRYSGGFETRRSQRSQRTALKRGLTSVGSQQNVCPGSWRMESEASTEFSVVLCDLCVLCGSKRSSQRQPDRRPSTR
jgi:hypothetical protein